MTRFKPHFLARRQAQQSPELVVPPPHYYFISGSDEDIERIAPIIQQREEAGQRFWIPQRYSRSREDIAAALERAAGLIVLCSPQAPGCHPEEFAHAARAGKPVAIVMLDGNALYAARPYVATRKTPAPAQMERQAPIRPRTMEERPRTTMVQSFSNAFTAGCIALFGFAIVQLTGGPPTQYEVQELASRAWAVMGLI